MQNISLAERGILPGNEKSLTRRLNDILQTLRGEENVNLLFAPGTYHFYPEKALEKMMYIANHDEDAVKSIAVDLSNFSGLILDGNGCTFLFHTEIVPFYLENCVNVSLKNF